MARKFSKLHWENLKCLPNSLELEQFRYLHSAPFCQGDHTSRESRLWSPCRVASREVPSYIRGQMFAPVHVMDWYPETFTVRNALFPDFFRVRDASLYLKRCYGHMNNLKNLLVFWLCLGYSKSTLYSQNASGHILATDCDFITGAWDIFLLWHNG